MPRASRNPGADHLSLRRNRSPLDGSVGRFTTWDGDGRSFFIRLTSARVRSEPGSFDSIGETIEIPIAGVDLTIRIVGVPFGRLTDLGMEEFVSFAHYPIAPASSHRRWHLPQLGKQCIKKLISICPVAGQFLSYWLPIRNGETIEHKQMKFCCDDLADEVCEFDP